MGLEAYLFHIKFESPIPEHEIIHVFEQAGMKHIPETQTTGEFRDFYFELRTQYGLTECHCLLAPEETQLTACHVRFSLLSPSTVIKQTFQLLSNLNRLTPISVYDTEILNHLYRELRKRGDVDASFQGIEGTAQETDMKQKCIIPIDVELFNMNQFGIQKRQIVLSNEHGDVIESGANTLEKIEKNDEEKRYFGWIHEEL